MKPLSSEYIRFERIHLNNLTNLWYETKDEELRLVVLRAREVLQKIYEKQKLPL